jgi:hypothetical protein
MPVPIRKSIKKATATTKGKIISIAVLLAFLSTVTLLIVYWNIIKKSFIRDKVKTAVQQKSDRLYSIHYDGMEMDEVSGYLSVTNLTLNYDTAKYLAIHDRKDIPVVLFKITVPSIIVTGVQTPKALITKEIVGGKLQITNPIIDIIYTHKGKDSTKSVPPGEVYRQILGSLELIKIDTFLITGAKIITRDIKTGKQELVMLDTYVQLRDVVIDSLSANDSTRLLFAKHLQINCKKLAWSQSDKLYNYEIDSISLNSDEARATVNYFKLIPTLDEVTYAHKKGMQADRYNISLNNIEINQINFHGLFDEKIEADNIVMTRSEIKIYRDMTLPPDKRSKIGTYPQQRVTQIPIPVKIGKLILKDTYVEYKELGRLMRKIGKVKFSDLNATFTNISNYKHDAGTNKIMKADVSAKFLNKYPVETFWTFYLFNHKGRFDVKGHLGTLDATGVNELAEPLGGAKIEHGTIKDLNFNFEADNYGMGGTVKFLYNDLKVSVLKKDDDTKALKKKKLASFGANLLIKNDNPKNDNAPRIATVHFERDTARSMFHLSWKTLMEGIKSSVME